MKPTRAQRAWQVWLALPEVIRLGAVILLMVVVGLAFLPKAQAAGEQQMPVTVVCLHGWPVAIQVVVPQAGRLTLQIPPDICTRQQQQSAPRPAPRQGRTT